MSEQTVETGIPVETTTKVLEIKGLELKGDTKAGIGLVDTDAYKAYLDDRGANYEIYKYKDNPTTGLLVVLDGQGMEKQIFDDLVIGKKNITGGFWSNSTVAEETVLERVAASKSMTDGVVGGGTFASAEKVRLTPSKIRELRISGLMIGFPQIEGLVGSVSGDSISVDFGGAVRLINTDDVVRVPIVDAVGPVTKTNPTL